MEKNSMNKKIKWVIVALLVFCTHLIEAFACTGFYIDDAKIYFGINENWYADEAKIVFRPAGNSKYGAVFFYHGSGFFTLSGINEAGLSLHIFMSDSKRIKGEGEENPIYVGYIDPLEYIMLNYANVDEALDEISKWDLSSIGLTNRQLFFADKNGNSVVVEGDDIIYKDSYYQVVTNFYKSDYPNPPYPCERYTFVDMMIRKSKEYSIPFSRDVLEATPRDLFYPTLYSFIGDLNEGLVYVYYKHHFEEVFVLNLQQELKKGIRRELSLDDVFASMALVSPTNNAVIEDTSVRFVWKGKPVNYILYLSEDEDFKDSETTAIPFVAKGRNSKIIILFVILLLLGAALLVAKAKPEHEKIIYHYIKIFLFLIAVAFCFCWMLFPDFLSSKYEMAIDYNQIKNGQQYYWKVQAEQTEGYKTTSAIGQFYVNW